MRETRAKNGKLGKNLIPTLAIAVQFSPCVCALFSRTSYFQMTAL